MNFSVFDWSRDPASIKHNTQYKTIHNQFKSFLSENCLTQIIVDVPTHVKGNTLGLVCFTNLSSLAHRSIVYPMNLFTLALVTISLVVPTYATV